jgi:hypothetical protein
MTSINSQLFYSNLGININSPDPVANKLQEFRNLENASDNDILDSLNRTHDAAPTTSPVFNKSNFQLFFAPFFKQDQNNYQSISEFFTNLRKKYETALGDLVRVENAFKKFATYLRDNFQKLVYLGDSKFPVSTFIDQLLAAEPKK